MMRLYSYFRSSTAYRVRIALHLKNIPHEIVPVNLAAGAQNEAAYKDINPMEAVPLLEHDGFRLTQSLAILNYLDNIAPAPPLAPEDVKEQAYVRQIALAIATDIHPLTNLRVLKYLGADEAKKKEWYAHWARLGMTGVEALLRTQGRCGRFACGEQVSVADLCIVPQMYNMRRYGLETGDLALCRRIEANSLKLDAFRKAAPEAQPDAPPGLEDIHGPGFKE